MGFDTVDAYDAGNEERSTYLRKKLAIIGHKTIECNQYLLNVVVAKGSACKESNR